MPSRVFLLLAILTAVPAAVSHHRPHGDARVHEASICWDPDVEFPVPCDDDDD